MSDKKKVVGWVRPKLKDPTRATKVKESRDAITDLDSKLTRFSIMEGGMSTQLQMLCDLSGALRAVVVKIKEGEMTPELAQECVPPSLELEGSLHDTVATDFIRDSLIESKSLMIALYKNLRNQQAEIDEIHSQIKGLNTGKYQGKKVEKGQRVTAERLIEFTAKLDSE